MTKYDSDIVNAVIERVCDELVLELKEQLDIKDRDLNQYRTLVISCLNKKMSVLVDLNIEQLREFLNSEGEVQE